MVIKSHIQKQIHAVVPLNIFGNCGLLFSVALLKTDLQVRKREPWIVCIMMFIMIFVLLLRHTGRSVKGLNNLYFLPFYMKCAVCIGTVSAAGVK